MPELLNDSRKLVKYVSKYWPMVVLLASAATASVFLRIYVPLLIGDTVNSVVHGKGISLVFRYAELIILVSAASAGLQFVVSYGSMRLSHIFAYSLRKDLFASIIGKSFRFFDRNPTGDLMSRSTMDIESLRRVISLASSQLFTTSLLLVVAAISLYELNISFSIVFFAIVPPLIVVTTILQVKQRPFWKKIRKKYGDMNSSLQENITGTRVVRSFSAQDAEIERFSGITKDYLDNFEAVSRIRAVFNPLLSLFVSLATASLLVYGGYGSIFGGISIGSLIAAINIFALVLNPVRFYGRFVVVLENGMASMNRINEILENRDVVADEPEAADASDVKGDVEFRDVYFSHEGHGVLKSVSFHAVPGEVIGIVGRTGSGKSTIVNLIPRFYDPDNGEILLDGMDIKSYRLESVRSRIGFVSQDIVLFSGTIGENISFSSDRSDYSEIEDAAQTARINDFVQSLPSGYDTLVGERGITLSGGQKQRVAIARALHSDPRVLILDDSTSSVDVHTEIELLRTLREAIRGRTVFILTHRISTLQLTDRILVLDGGKIVQDGKLADLAAEEGEFREIFRTQIESAGIKGGPD